jgi:hypothetical protein
MELKMANFHDFHKFMDLWEKHLNTDFIEKIKTLLDNNDLIFFFTRDSGEIFGCDEDARLTFARIKSPEPEDEDWAQDASFSAHNLSRALNGDKSKNIFSKKDLKEIKIIDRKEVERLLNKQATKAGGPIITDLKDDDYDGLPANMINLKDKK